MPTWWVGACRQDLQRSKCKYLLHFRRHSSRISSTVYCSRFSLQFWTSRLSFRPLFKAFENGLLGKTALKEGCYLLSSNLNETSRNKNSFLPHPNENQSTFIGQQGYVKILTITLVSTHKQHLPKVQQSIPIPFTWNFVIPYLRAI